MNRTPELVTARLRLRQWTDADLAGWAAMNADPRVREFFPGALTREQAAASLDHFRAGLAARGWGWWAVEVTATGEFIGMAGLDPVDDDVPVTGVEAGWRLAAPAWGHGYATEAARAVLDHGFRVLRLPEILAITVAGNARSRAVMERLGMVHDRSADFDDRTVPPGPLRPSVVYRLKRPCARPDAAVRLY
ncbi:GNAT family N-acetyltransferase [Actinoplanes teichomyceticus]|uniref:RimJ/RimL family protein N-acetyltransferase n=1 Tax=Actinoplanes teichomyceticus TaxID=1867 RepID=A0A561WJP3_ACTTI|nr:GNAT family N-acetyltransferase [Actinoplanes teichomyceticus]TWG24053.1 RimJ/RimL family protein N-acetyltransferase [Actinoplanes teichomyceticus]GIF12094.1 N-acetyltransferase [Actinoplanes teichomyceticus]